MPGERVAAFSRPSAKEVRIVGLAHPVSRALQLFRGKIAEIKGDLLRHHYLHPLALLDGLHEGGGIVEAVVRAGVEPGKATPELSHAQLAPVQIRVVDVGDLELAAG